MTKRKLALIGLDAALPSIIQDYFARNKLPNLKKIASEGCWAEGIPVFPTHTASNWNTVSTGAWPKTHGVTDMVVHLPGTPLTEITSGFYSNLCQAEQIWKTCDRFQKKSILLKYIASWPPNLVNGIQVEGFGAPGGPGARPWGSSPLALANSSCYSNIPLESAKMVSINRADLSNWKDLGFSSHLPPLESGIVVGTPKSNIVYDILLLASSSNTYDSALVTKNKEANKGLLLKIDQVSDWLVEDFTVNNNIIKAAFRMKLINIGNSVKDQEKFRLFVSQVYPLEGWTFPETLAKDLVNKFGPFLESISHFPFAFGWIDEGTYLDDLKYQANWLGNATKYLMVKYDWDLYMTQWHGIDYTQHAFLRFDKSVLSEPESQICDKVVLGSYEIADELVGEILQGISQNKSDGNEDIYTFILSDHGHVLGKRRFFVNGYLYQKGFINLKRDPTSGKIVIDWTNTVAFAQGMVHIYVNLKGRDPQGIINPGKEYEDTVERLIDALYDVKDPKTGLRPMSLVLNKTDAEFIGLSGDRAGDVIFAAAHSAVIDNRVRVKEDLFEDVKVGFKDGSIHGQQLPSVSLGQQGTIRSFFIAHGPTIRKGYRRTKPISLLDVAPTIAYILDIPPPKDSEGKIMYDLFE